MDGRESNWCRLLAQRASTLGPDHPYTLACQHQLALHLKKSAWQRGGKEATRRKTEAMSLLQSAWAGRLRVLGAAHPYTLESLDHYVYLVWDTRGSRAALPLCRHAVEVRTRALGPEHPATLSSLHQLAMVLSNVWQLGQPAKDEAEALFWRVLGARERVHGPTHALLHDTRDRLEGVLIEQGKCVEAITMRRCAWQQFAAQFGSEHPNTQWMAANLDRIRQRQPPV